MGCVGRERKREWVFRCVEKECKREGEEDLEAAINVSEERSEEKEEDWNV